LDVELLRELEAKAAALRFRGQNDPLDFVAHSQEHMTGGNTVPSIHAANLYCEGKVAAYLSILPRWSDHEYQLAFLRVPRVAHDGPDTRDVMRTRIMGDDARNVADLAGDKGAMFLRVTELVETPEGVIPSFVWVTATKEHYDFRREIAGNSTSIDIVIEAGKVVCERKVGGFGVGFPARQRRSVTRLIEGRPQIVHGVEENAGQYGREVFGEAEFMEVLAGLKIFLNNVDPWVAVSELLNSRVEIVDVVQCARDGETRAVEQNAHEHKIRSDEKP
jgi:hypothetical protein